MKIAQLDAQIQANHFSNVQLFNDLTEAQRELGLLQGSRPTCPFLRPHFISRQQYNAISHAAEVLHTAFEAMTNVALENAEMLSLLDLTEAEERMARINPGYKNLCVTSRLDTFLCGEDFKFLEYNAESPAGIGDQMQLEIVLEKIPEVKDFLVNNRHWRPKPHVVLLESLLLAYREFGGKKEKPNIAIVDWKDVATGSEFVILQDYFNSKGFETRIFDPYELEYDGEKLHVGDFAIDVFYKRVIIHEFLEKFDETHPFSRAYADGKVCMANSFRVKIPHKKASFAILSDEKYADIFSNKQLEIIKKHIPWTRKVSDSKTTFHGETVDLLELLRREQSKFVLKPNDDYGGKGISFGWETTESEWQTAIENALQDSFVVQERVPIEKFTFPTYSENVEMIELLVDFDPFLFMGKVEGGLVRLSSSSLVNVTQGGGQTALIVLED
jgi:glutathionylspermidine synthase